MNKKIYCFYKVENNVMLNKISYMQKWNFHSCQCNSQTLFSYIQAWETAYFVE